ncbi:hypothetical protein [Streptococcus suis]|uniref:hypothetical protein n=1 Tax=Streptococcus suis TaxID=1307 RepID=UPI00040EE70B|nr:hypothetical protein [Streptococcus suis]
MLESLKQKLMEFIGLDELEPATSSDNKLVTMAQLQAENRELRAIIKKQGELLQDLSNENMDLGRDRQFWANTAVTQRRLLDIYEEKQSGGKYETQTA